MFPRRSPPSIQNVAPGGLAEHAAVTKIFPAPCASAGEAP
jgi:hypothetical protein